MHRELPDYVRIKGIHLILRKLATKNRWTAVLSCEAKEGFQDEPFPERGNLFAAERLMPYGFKINHRTHRHPDVPAEVGVDIGFRLRPYGIRVAYWHDSNDNHGELFIPNRIVKSWQQVEAIQSARDIAFDDRKPHLVGWLQDNKHPEWLRDMTLNLHAWKSKARLMQVAEAWRTQRFAGDEVMFDMLEMWRKYEKKMYETQENLRKYCQDWRKGLYRNFSAWLRREYAHIHVESTSGLKKMAARKPVDSDESQTAITIRWQQRTAALSILATQMLESPKTIKEDPAYTTQACHHCQHIDNFDAMAELEHTCTQTVTGSGIRTTTQRSTCCVPNPRVTKGIRKKQPSHPDGFVIGTTCLLSMPFQWLGNWTTTATHSHSRGLVSGTFATSYEATWTLSNDPKRNPFI